MIKTIITLLIVCSSVFAQDDLKYQTVLNAPFTTVAGKGWVSSALQSMSPTAVCLRISWNRIEKVKNIYKYEVLDKALDSLIAYKMNIFLRISFGGESTPKWAFPENGTFNAANFIADQNGNICIGDSNRIRAYRINYSGGPFTVSFSDSAATELLVNRYETILFHIKQYLIQKKAIDRLIVVTPTINPDEEMEYPVPAQNQGTGYERLSIVAFQKYLQSKYGSIIKLNAEWKSTFSNFTEIAPAKYNWHLDPDNIIIQNDFSKYVYPPGRIDWYLYRQSQLQKHIAQFAAINKKVGVRFGLRLGSIQDEAMEDRGFYDITSLAEYADWIHVAPVAYQEGTHDIQADYLRSVANFWSKKRGTKVRFSEESNWPEILPASVAIRNKAWTRQLDIFKKHGSSAHFLMGWEYLVRTGYAKELQQYSPFIDAYKKAGNTKIVNISKTYAIHLSELGVAVSMGKFFPESGFIPAADESTYTLIPLAEKVRRSILPDDKWSYKNFYSGYAAAVDFVTDYMINSAAKDPKSLAFLNQYSRLIFPRGSYYIKQETYENLLNKKITCTFANGTYYVDNFGKVSTIIGYMQSYSQRSSDIASLIWRTRPDIHNIWPTGNKPNKNSKYKMDFIDWLITVAYPEYPSLNLNYKNWNLDFQNLWNDRKDLQRAFPDGYHGKGVTILDWATDNTYFPSNKDLYHKYWNWPYRGDIFNIIAVIAGR